MSTKTIESHKTRHLLDQIHLAKQVHATGRGHDHRPAILRRVELTTKSRETLLHLLITHIGSCLALSSQRPQKLMKGVTAKSHHRFRIFLSRALPADASHTT